MVEEVFNTSSARGVAMLRSFLVLRDGGEIVEVSVEKIEMEGARRCIYISGLFEIPLAS